MKKLVGNPGTQLGPVNSDEQWDKDGWSDKPISIQVASRLTTTISIRLDEKQSKLVRRAARLRATTLSEFVRSSTLAEATRVDQNNAAPVRVISAVVQPSSRVTTSATASANSVDVGLKQLQAV